jgi:hypothetical protein
MVMGTIGEGDDGLSSNKDTGGNFAFHLEVEPFSQVKSGGSRASAWRSALVLPVGAE